MPELAALSFDDLSYWIETARSQAGRGQIAHRIPRLAEANPKWLGVHVQWGEQRYSAGDTAHTFSLMSVVKPFQLLYLLEHYGAEQVFQWVGQEPSAASFNSLNQLQSDGGRPRNPMINSGAIVLAAKLPGNDGRDRCQRLCNWLNQRAGCHLTLDEPMLVSIQSVSREPNQALVRYLHQTGHLRDPSLALDTYEHICCLSGQVNDLAQLGILLGVGRDSIAPRNRHIVNALMLTCGLYEASARYAVRIGLPMKSGVSGALIAVIPRQGAIACYSPALDSIGNPVAGLAFVERLAQARSLSIFC